MKKPFSNFLNFIADHFRKDTSKMLIATGVAGWTLSSLAQIAAIAFNPKLSKEQKSFLVPQEFADAVVNIGSFFVVTLSVKKLVSKLFSTGKFATSKVRNHLNKNKELYRDKIGKIDFCIDDIKYDKNFPIKEYHSSKNVATTVATVAAGILSSNILTPIGRNFMASDMQKKYLNSKNNKKNPVKVTTNISSSTNLRI
jgi:hypothetical protein